MTKQLNQLIPDIYEVFSEEHVVCEENLNTFAHNIKEALVRSIEEANQNREFTLRMSKIGVPDRKIWYEANIEPNPDAPVGIDPVLAIKFLYGHILEELILFLVRESGHKVEGEQDELDIGGVKGHRDCKIDGITIDVKSASRFGFEKFKNGTILTQGDDPFGYVPQISGYVQADGGDKGGFLVINKESGELALLLVESIDMINAEQRITDLKGIVERKEPPENLCYNPVPMGKAGNISIHKNCTYCKFKELCFKDSNNGMGLRKFQYANGVTYLTEVVKPPNVPELL